MGIFPKVRGENKKYLKPPPRLDHVTPPAQRRRFRTPSNANTAAAKSRARERLELGAIAFQTVEQVELTAGSLTLNQLPSLKLTANAHENPHLSWVSYHQNGGFPMANC